MNFRVALTAIAGLLATLAAAPPAPAQDEQRVREVEVARDAFVIDPALPGWVEEAAIPTAAGNEPLVVRLADTQMRAGDTPMSYVRRAMVANATAALGAAGQILISFIPQYQTIKLHSVKLHRGTEVLDRTRSSNVRFLQRETDLEKGVQTGEVTAVLVVDDLRVGDTLDYAYSIYGQNPVFGGRYVDTMGWDLGVPTLLRRGVVSYPESTSLDWRLIGDRGRKDLAPRREVKDGMVRLIFEERGLPATETEPSLAPDFELYRWIQLSQFKAWSEVSDWAINLFKLDQTPNTELAQIITNLRALPDAEARVAGALGFVQREVRYMSLSLGESSHRPAAPDVVLARRYGDCKDKSLLLIAILKALDVPAEPVLLQYGSRRRVDLMLPSPLLFDHVIVRATVGGEQLYLDPTRQGQYGGLRDLGQIHDGAHVLVAAAGTSKLAEIQPRNRRQLARNELIETAEIARFGEPTKLAVRHTWHGVQAEHMRGVYDTIKEARFAKALSDEMEGRYPGAAMIGAPRIEDDRQGNRFIFAATYTIPKFAQEQAGNWLVPYSAPNFKGSLAPLPTSTRKWPLQIAMYPFDGVYQFEARLPQEVSAFNDPRSTQVRGKHFEFRSTTSFRGNQIKARLELSTLAARIDPPDFAAYAKDIEALGKAAGGYAYVSKAALKARPAKREKAPEAGQTISRNLTETIEKSSQAIKSGRLTGKDLSQAHCLRGEARSQLGQAEAALADVNAAVALSTAGHACRGYVHFILGDFRKSVDDYTKAISLGEDSPHLYKQRALSHIYAGAFAAARDDLVKASETTDKEALAFTDLWHTLALNRLGEPIPETVRERAKAGMSGDWPRPAVAMMTGLLKPADVLQAMERKTGGDLTLARSEGYFYIGQYYLGQGDQARAREFFEKSRQQQIVVYLEHIAAGFELQRLPRAEGAIAAAAAPAGVAAAARKPAAGDVKRGPKPAKGAGSGWAGALEGCCR